MTMTADETRERKKEMIEKSVEQFRQLNDENKMFILGYMLGIQQKRQKIEDKDAS